MTQPRRPHLAPALSRLSLSSWALCAVLGAGLLSGCADELGPEGAATAEGGAYLAHDEPSDFDPLAVVEGKADMLPRRFDPHWIMSDAFFTDAYAVSADDVQAFLEASPYEKRSWLADEHVGELRAADAIVQAGVHQGINPIVLLARMQVEMGAISKSERPSRRAIDYAFGCGCPDNRSCIASFKGLDKQMECAGETLRRHYDLSVSAEGLWRAGRVSRTLDSHSVTPANHSTAALYSYTPWVLRGRGGNWLVWNVTRKFEQFFIDKGLIQPAEGCFGAAANGKPPFVGTPCGCDSDCGFTVRAGTGWCHPAGFCTLGCEGTCPDHGDYASTFCIAADPDDLDAGGVCAAQATESNGHCADLPGTLDLSRDRFIGDSDAAARAATVCAPAE